MEEVEAGTYIPPDCTGTAPYVSTGDTGPNSLQYYKDSSTGLPMSCRFSAWTGHHFAVTGPGAVQACVSVMGVFDGNFRGARTETWSLVQLLDLGPDGLTTSVLVERELFREGTPLQVSPVAIRGPFGAELCATLRPGRTYGVRLLGLASVDVGPVSGAGVDFGSPGSGHNIHYDSIEVCLDQPATAGPGGVDDQLELRLYENQCMPSVWMPAAQGGRLEEARTLVGDLFTRAVATGDAGVNAHVAQSRLDQADAQIAGGQYQRACRSLSDALHALTTP